eukprot:TRINITY_DN2999_c0_g1_i1.p1 TRINITY_DN2999_c0_g1~~TRINITY_DN2999_c0_g1_i1.p1  ORF type:complete len:193 (+),score=29.24 TRINITY_DN2999_c0_g1_i1:60-638(+)
MLSAAAHDGESHEATQSRCDHWSHVQRHLPLLNPFRVVDPEGDMKLAFPPPEERPRPDQVRATPDPRDVKHPTRDTLDRIAVQRALWSRKDEIEWADGKVFVVVSWRKDPTAASGVSTACYVRSCPPDESMAPFHTDLRRLLRILDHRREVPVIVVDSAVRREHQCTYLVVVTYPWAAGKPQRRAPLRADSD